MDIEKRREDSIRLRKAAEPLIKLINEYYHAHVTVIVTSTSVELLEGIHCIQKIYEYIPD